MEQGTTSSTSLIKYFATKTQRHKEFLLPRDRRASRQFYFEDSREKAQKTQKVNWLLFLQFLSFLCIFVAKQKFSVVSVSSVAKKITRSLWPTNSLAKLFICVKFYGVETLGR
jgi:hypothetical protein